VADSSVPDEAVPRLSPRARVQTDKVSGKPVLISPESVLVLNPTGAEIVALCDGVRTLGEIGAALAAQYNAPPETIAAQVASYLIKLRERNLVSW
jgi:pyrroloquinoline quinone biosynthesis protein D